MIEEKSDIEILDIFELLFNFGYECQFCLCFFMGKDFKFVVCSIDIVFYMKRWLYVVEGVELGSQWWFFFGRFFIDKMKFEELKILKDYVVQVIVS